MSNLDEFFAGLGVETRRTIFQALCTERDRLTKIAKAKPNAGVSAEDILKISVLTEKYAANMVADACCGNIMQTHAFCE